ncbi:hypothetical protein DFP72DRAFT_925729 [Ephemerocybe angulata]|uniref:Transmembrane protein n=1 Tax=Ephemerocybe angulata TaxID=980116 RepID=A0A8H6HEM3_9AGAR|nr:hypothetical protein DFP72DRAFT_925729 [Tulosesus angulatus]
MTFKYRNACRWLPLTMCIWLKVFGVAFALHTNFTVGRNDASILYLPPEAWEPVLDWSGERLRPERIGMRGSAERLWDSDRRTGNADATPQSSSSTDSPVLLQPSSTRTKRRRKRCTKQVPKRTPTTLQLDFTGSALYLFGFGPLSPSSTITIDGQPYPPDPQSLRSSNDLGATPTQLLAFSTQELDDVPHKLVVTLGIDSRRGPTPVPVPPTSSETTLSTQSGSSGNAPLSSTPPSTSSATTGTSTSTSGPASASATPDKKRNVATFGAAVGGSVGVLALFSAGLALSIIRRRYRCEETRTPRPRGQPHDPSPHPPQFFPGTEVPPSDPPGYNDVVGQDIDRSRASGPVSHHLPYLVALQQAELDAASGRGSHPYFHPEPHRAGTPEDMSYADIPPSDPPPPGVEVDLEALGCGEGGLMPRVPPALPLPGPSFPEALRIGNSTRSAEETPDPGSLPMLTPEPSPHNQSMVNVLTSSSRPAGLSIPMPMPTMVDSNHSAPVS